MNASMNSPVKPDAELPRRRTPVNNRQEKGVALVTTLLILLLISTMCIGVAWLVMGDQKLGGNNIDRQLAFYGAEAGMESLSASLENLFNSNPSPNAADVNALMVTPGPPNIPNIQYIAPGETTPGTGYQITFTPNPNNTTVPNSVAAQITSGTYAGLVGLLTPYTLTVTARTTSGSEVMLQRVIQTAEIPVFQFGFFSQMDLAFFAGPNFNFGGRVHTNGNLWLAEGTGSGNALTFSQKVTTAGEVITENLENGWLTSNDYTNPVNITYGSGVTNLVAQTPNQSVNGSNNSYPVTTGPPTIGSYNSAWGPLVNSSKFNGNIEVGQPNGPVAPLNLSIATPNIGGQPIDLIRRPQPNENTTNPAKLAERYYGNANLSLRILLSDYGPGGTCATSDIDSTGTNALPGLSAGAPIDLATLAWDVSSGGNANNGTLPPPYVQAPTWMPAGLAGKTVFPLPVSGAKAAPATYISSGTGYSGYWIQQYYPIITGCIKIEYQNAGGTWVDVTQEILEQGYTGRNINPQTGVTTNNVPAFSSYSLPLSTGVPLSSLAPPQTNSGPQVDASGPTGNTAVTTVGCQDPSPNAVIRLARVRDNPSTALGGTTGNNYCGGNPSTGGSGTWYPSGKTSTATCTTVTIPTATAPNCYSQHGTDYWPNVLYDTREALTRDFPLLDSSNNPQYTLAGGMYYVELDVANLAKWFTGAIGSSGKSALNTTGYAVYFSDRRAERLDNQTPPPSVGPSPILTGGYGYEDIVNAAADAKGCPDNALEQGEDDEGDYTNGVDSTPVLKTYGGTPAFDNSTVTGIVSTIVTLGTTSNILQSNNNCTGTVTTPFAVVESGSPLTEHPQELRENPPLLFRRALKVVDGSTISLGCNNATAGPPCSNGSTPYGLTIASENPVYVQGCFNNPTECNMTSSTSWSTNSVAASVVADAVTLLSDNWNDVNSFIWPYGFYNSGATAPTPKWQVGNGGRNGVGTTYRMAVAAGKGIPFKQPTFTNVYEDFGTDGGAHNFMRFLENWSGTLYYEGSIVSIWYNHQAEGIYKCCNEVYGPPSRGYQFDSNFLAPSLLPPLTPMARTVNTIGFTQMLLPTATAP